MKLQDLELHDAQILGVTLDAPSCSVEVRLAYYPNEKAHERVQGVLKFSGVSHFNQLMDLGSLKDHASAGNVSYWVTGETPGKSYIYLARGLIELSATAVELLDPAK